MFQAIFPSDIVAGERFDADKVQSLWITRDFFLILFRI
jgi:hypothetical protein